MFNFEVIEDNKCFLENLVTVETNIGNNQKYMGYITKLDKELDSITLSIPKGLDAYGLYERFGRNGGEIFIKLCSIKSISYTYPECYIGNRISFQKSTTTKVVDMMQ